MMFGLFIQSHGPRAGRRWFHRPHWEGVHTSRFYGLWCPEEIAFLTAYADGWRGRFP